MFRLPRLQSYKVVLALDEAGDLQGWVQICVQHAAPGADSERRVALDASSHLQIRRVVVSEQPVVVSNELLHPDQLQEKVAGSEVAYSHDGDGKLRVQLPEQLLERQFFLGIRYACAVQQADIGVFNYSPFVREPRKQSHVATSTTTATATSTTTTTTTSSTSAATDMFGIATQFEPCHTATAFPCWDHPSCKATFEFRVLVPNDLQVLSCGEVAYVAPHDAASQWWTFQETIPLPPYVTGFWIARFHPVEHVHSDGRVLRLQCFDAAQQSQAQFGLKMGLASWLYFEELFGVPIPTRKMDLIPLPRLHGLAMENFSAITFRDEYLFVGPDTSHHRERRIARLVCHEMSHMYWGNLVTLTTFDELWLKEGMARFFEYVAVQDIAPSYQIWINFLTDVYMQAMEVDSKPLSTHPIVQFHDGDMGKIMDSFDVITYGKGACVLRMLYHLLGRERFSAGMKQCVARHHLANMSTDDLWSCLQESVMREELDLREVMMPWLLQPGFPIVVAECALDEHGQPRTLVLRQLTFQRLDAVAASQHRWPIPLVVRLFFETADGSVHEQTQRIVLSTDGHEIAIAGPADQASRLCGVIVNGYHATFCCTYYDATLWSYYRAAVSSPAATDEELFGAAIDHLFLSKTSSLPAAALCLSERGLEMTRVFKALESGSKLAKGFGRIYLLVPEMQRLSRVTTVAGQDEAERLTREVEALEQECEFLISEYLQLGRKFEEVCTTMMTLQQHVLAAKSIVERAVARAVGEQTEQAEEQQQQHSE